MSKTLLTISMFLSLVLASGCQKDPVVQFVESLQFIESAMDRNLDGSEKLLVEMDACIEKYKDVWAKTNELFSNPNDDSIDRSVNVQGKQIRDIMQHIIDMDLAIQDNYQDNPQMMSAYLQRIQRIR